MKNNLDPKTAFSENIELNQFAVQLFMTNLNSSIEIAKVLGENTFYLESIYEDAKTLFNTKKESEVSDGI